MQDKINIQNQQSTNKSSLLRKLNEAEDKILAIRVKQRELAREEEELWKLIHELRSQIYPK